MKRSITLLLPLAFLLVSCLEKELPARLTAAKDAFSFENPAVKTTLEITATRPWSASSDASWCKVFPESGGGGPAPTDLHILCEENTGIEERSCQITLHSGGLSQTIRVLQNHKQGVLIPDKDFTLEPDAQTLRIPIWKTGDYAVEIEDGAAEWIHIVRTRAMTEDDLVLSIDENTSDTRTGRIRVSIDGKEENLSVKQKSGYIKFEDKELARVLIYSFDRDQDGRISYDEALLATGSVNLSYGINSVAGLEHFVNLSGITCRAPVKVLDLRPFKKLKTLQVYEGVRELILSDLPTLKEVDLHGTALTRLEINGCPSVSTLTLGQNSIIRELDFRNCKSLSELRIIGCPLIKSFDVQDFPSLKSCFLNLPGAERIHLENLPALREASMEGVLALQDYRITGCPLLESLQVSGFQSEALDLSGFPSLKRVTCTESEIKQLKLSGLRKLEILFLSWLPLETLDLSDCQKLSNFFMEYTKVDTLDLTPCPELGTIDVCDCRELRMLYLIAGHEYEELAYTSNWTKIIYK